MTYTDTEKFLLEVFGPDYGTRAIFANLEPAAHVRDFRQLDLARGCYWSIAAFGPEAVTHKGGGALEVRALVIDDVGTKVPAVNVEMALGTPTAIVESSLSNFQWAYRLATPVPVEQWKAFAEAVQARVGCKLDSGYSDPVHLFRLPMGVNVKKGGFAVQLTELNSGIELSVGKYLDFATPTTEPAPPASADDARRLNLDQLEELMDLIPNDIDRDGWVDVGHGLKALCLYDEDGFEVFDAWSQQHDSYDAAKTRTAWDSFGASGLRSKGGRLRARAEGLNPERFKQWEASTVFNDGVIEAEPPPKPEPRKGLTATPFKWMDLSKTAPRDWLYGDILLRKFISMTVAPGGTGKSSLIAVETLAQATGKTLLGDDPSGELRVWLWNLEDTYEETQKKILAAAKHYRISEEDIGDRLFVDSGRDQQLVIAEMRGTVPVIMRPVVTALVEQIRLRKIDVVVIDPFVSCHWVPENDNGAMDMVVKEWGRVAEEGNCAVHLVDHTSKAGSKEVVTNSSRGAVAKTDAARVVRVVNRMTDTDGRMYGITENWRYFNTFNDKANMAPPKARRDWFRMASIQAENGGGAAQAFSVGAAAVPVRGDSIGVVVQWTPPNAKAMATGDAFTNVVKVMGTKRWRTAPQSKDWVGNAVAQGCGLLRQSTQDLTTINTLIKTWISEGLFKIVPQLDEHRKMKDYIEITQVY